MATEASPDEIGLLCLAEGLRPCLVFSRLSSSTGSVLPVASLLVAACLPKMKKKLLQINMFKSV